MKLTYVIMTHKLTYNIMTYKEQWLQVDKKVK